jgi:hypothetical protein
MRPTTRACVVAFVLIALPIAVFCIGLAAHQPQNLTATATSGR